MQTEWIIEVKGMSCVRCANRLQQALAETAGVSSATVDLLTERARVSGSLTAEALVAAITATGFKPVLQQESVTVLGMSCSRCAARIEQQLRALPGVVQADVLLASDKLRVQFLPQQLSATDIAAQVAKAGYQLELPSPEGQSQTGAAQNEMTTAAGEFAAHEPANTAATTATMASEAGPLSLHLPVWWPVAVSLLLTAPLILPMLLQPLFGHAGDHSWMLPAFWQWLLATPVQFYFGARFYQAGWAAIKAGSSNMDVLVALGTSAAYGLSLYSWWQGNPHGHLPDLYFESSSAVISLVLLGKYLEQKAKRRTTDALRALEQLQPATATVWRAGSWQQVLIQQVQPGDRLQVLPGARIPVDGKIVSGRSHVDEALLTGEPVPKSKQAGDQVLGGAINSDGVLEIVAEQLAAQSLLAQIIQQVEQAQSGKVPVQALVDRVSQVFVPAVLLVALLTLLATGVVTDDWRQAVLHAVAVLVIACPCALGLATPAALMAGTGTAARLGILIKDASVLGKSSAINLVLFDKTGTLTAGTPELCQFSVLPSAGVTNSAAEALWLARAGGLAQYSQHPLSKAVLRAAQVAAVDTASQADWQALEQVPGFGISGEWQQRRYWLGSSDWMQTLGLQPDLSLLQVPGASVSWLAAQATDGTPQLLALLAFTDSLKPGAVAAVQLLQQQGVELALVSGDHALSVERVAAQLGIKRQHAGVKPAEKAALVQQYQQQGYRVAMVGDGVNDAPALAQADLGIAMATGTDVAVHAAAISLLRGEPALVADALQLTQRTYQKIKQNLFWAFAFNTLGIPAAALGYLNPVLAGSAMALSSVLVVSNALWLQRYRPQVLTLVSQYQQQE